MAKNRGKKKKAAPPKSRKELRKEKRQKKKENKRQFFSKKKKPGEFVTKAVETKTELDDQADSEIIESDFELSDEEVKSKLNKVSKNVKNVPTQPDRFHENQDREKKKQKELQRKMRKRRIEQLKTANEEDDKIIRKLEKKLKIDKHKSDKSVHKMFSDGLDYALELCLPENVGKMYAAAKEAAELKDSEDEFEEDMAIALGKGEEVNSEKEKSKSNVQDKSKRSNLKKNKKRQSKLSKIESKYFKDDFESDLGGSDSEFHDSENESPIEIKKQRGREPPAVASDGEDSDYSEDQLEEDLEEGTEYESDGNEDSEVGASLDVGDDEDNSEVEDDENNSIVDDEDKPTSANNDNNLWEDIYGRKRDKEGNVLKDDTKKYIPPHIRARLEATENLDDKRKEKLEQLRRQCKGFMNRLSEANMHKIASEIENVYMKNPRFDVNNTLHKLMMEALVTNVLCKDRMVLEHAMLVAILHGNIGSEIGE